jgi:TfoX/Sxy family transcriptional regulator of competence genes
MAYDEELAARIRDLVAAERSVTEKKMFGGLAFLLNGNMAVAASGGQRGLLVRVDPDESDKLLKRPGASLMEMRGRTMPGWMRVEGDAVRTKQQLSFWVGRGVTFARSLPPKR